jgi:ribosome-binding protein aMBF1 (putative translation factor)
MEAHKNEDSLTPPTSGVPEERVVERVEGGKPASRAAKPEPQTSARKAKNNVRKLRTERMMSKAELARRAQISVLTVDRVERGMSCRMDTKRKILEALGLRPQDRVMVFGESEDD